MSAPAAPAPTGPTFTIRGRPYPVLLPKLGDPRLHLAAVIISLQVIGQIGFHFELSIAQILLAVGTALTVQTSIGFLLTMVSIQLVPPVAAVVGWRWAFLMLAFGPMAGIAAIRRLRAAEPTPAPASRGQQSHGR